MVKRNREDKRWGEWIGKILDRRLGKGDKELHNTTDNGYIPVLYYPQKQDTYYYFYSIPINNDIFDKQIAFRIDAISAGAWELVRHV